MSTQGSGKDPIEPWNPVPEVLAEPPGLSVPQVGEPVVIVGAEGRLRVSNQE
jgi:hypothetical protein